MFIYFTSRNSTEQNLSSEANSCKAKQEIPALYETRKMTIALTQASPYLQPNQAHTIPSYFFKVHLKNTVLPAPKSSQVIYIFPPGYVAKAENQFMISRMYTTCPNQLVCLDL
jgi:hypothetical protein